ncbi:MAG TPA: amidohydrolase family protein [Candidatus Saccharimonadales bacterium]|nr:amidohydrolase family protein [Candidatus Saccharimonadales bacterium]
MEFDVIIRGGSVIDGTASAKAHPADVGVRDGKIAAIGDLEGSTARLEIDARNRIVVPGFIDAHTHTEIALPQDGALGRFANVRQGVTSVMTAPDGFGWAPLSREQAKALWRSTIFATGPGDFDFEWDTVEKFLSIFNGRIPENVIPMAPHNGIRYGAMGWQPRVATPEELGRMKAAVREWMEAGAVGLNAGLDYQPGSNSDTHELVELCKVVAEFGGVYAAHIRYQGVGTGDAFRETMTISREAGIPVSVAHYNVEAGSKEFIDEAERAGDADFSFESYMYPAGSTHFLMNLPLSEQVGGPDALQERMHDPAYRDRIVADLEHALANQDTTKARIYFSETKTGRFIGQTIPEAAASMGLSMRDFVTVLVEEELPDALLVYHRGFTDEEFEPTIRATIAHPRMLVASDGIAHGRLPHPRGAGTFARVLRYQVRELHAVSLETAIHKMSGFVADRYRVTDRGRLAPGLAADIAVFDADTVADRSTWTEPRLEPVGIDAVLVNGRRVMDHGTWTGELPGVVVRKR